jgi:hypothetical protein
MDQPLYAGLSVRLASITDREVTSAATWLETSLTDIAPTYGYKKRPQHVPKKMFLDMLENYKVMMMLERCVSICSRTTQGWASTRLADTTRMTRLSAAKRVPPYIEGKRAILHRFGYVSDLLARLSVQVLVSVFRKQAWSRLTDDMRLGVLTVAEEKAAFRFEASPPATMDRKG